MPTKRLVLGAIMLVLTAFTMVVVGLAEPAAAHGSTTDPPSRNYGCWARWGTDHLNPNMGQTDPMCAQAWQANPNTMWNWNALFREGVAGNHQASIPDGQLCSGGRTQGGLYASLDAVGPWVAKTMPNNFTLTITDQARHGADYLLIYVTRQGFDPTTQPLTWASLELVQRTGAYPTTGLYQAQVSAGSRTGRHVVYTIWQASHMDQPYYLCSDVIFDGSTGGPTQPPPPPPPPASCTASYAKNSEWNGGFNATVTVTAGSRMTSNWVVTWTWANGQSITGWWNAKVMSDGASVAAASETYNGRLTPGQSTSFGFNASWNATNSAPAVSCTAS